MRVLADSCVAGQAVAAMRAAGWDVRWSAEADRDPGDTALLGIAHRDGRILITIDKDYGELAVMHRHPHSGIVRLVGLSALTQGVYAMSACTRYAKELAHGAIVTVEQGRVRVRPGAAEDE